MPERSGHSRGDVVAVIDIGSNSGRVMVFERDTSSHLRLLAGSRAPLRLVHDVDARGALSEATMARTMEALRDFQAIATGAGAKRIVAVATAAMRDATNGALFARAGATRAGDSNRDYRRAGGSALRFRRRGERARRVERPALRSRRRQPADHPIRAPPAGRRRESAVRGASTEREIPRVRSSHRQAAPASARPCPKPSGEGRVARLASGDRLVGTGGTLRNLAKIDRQTRRYPIGGLHGYELSVDRLAEVVDRLAATQGETARRHSRTERGAGRFDCRRRRRHSDAGGVRARQTHPGLGSGRARGHRARAAEDRHRVARDGERGLVVVARLAVRRMEARGRVAPAGRRRRRSSGRSSRARPASMAHGDRSAPLVFSTSAGASTW